MFRNRTRATGLTAACAVAALAAMTPLTAIAAPTTPSPAPTQAATAAKPATGQAAAYQLGTYSIQVNADCSSGTVSVSGFDSRAVSFGVALNPLDLSTGGTIAYGKGTMTNGAGTLTFNKVPGATVPTDAQYAIYVQGPGNGPDYGSFIMAQYSGVVHCDGKTATTTAAKINYKLSTTCAPASGTATVSVTFTNDLGGVREFLAWPHNSVHGVGGYVAPTRTVTLQPGATGTATLPGLEAGEWLLELGTQNADGSGTRATTSAAIDIPACAAATQPAQNTAPSAPAPAQEQPAPAQQQPAAAQPDLANTGGRN